MCFRHAQLPLVYTRKISATKTTAQQAQATGKSPAPKYERIIPTARAMIPATGDCVASTMAGKVITARVMYGT